METLAMNIILHAFAIFLQNNQSDFAWQGAVPGVAVVEKLATSVNWIIVRCPWLRDNIQKEETKVREACLAKGKAMIRREDVASFIFQQIFSDEWMHKKPTVTYWGLK
jgi:hypothetical protein